MIFSRRLPAFALALIAAGCGAASAPPPPPPAPVPVASAAPVPVPPAPAPPKAPLPPPWTPTSPPDVSMGAAAPTLVVAVAPDGRWAVLCQARADTNRDGRLEVDIGMHGDPYGDALVPYLVEGTGPGDRIDDFLGADAEGRFLLLLRGGRPVLHDSLAGRDTTLRGEPAPARFGASGDELVYTRKQGAARLVVVRTLATGAERTFDPGPGDILWMEIHPRAAVLHLVMRLPGPGRDASYSNLYGGPCGGSPASSYGWSISTRRREQRLLSLTDGRVVAVEGEITPFSNGWLHTLADGSPRFDTFPGGGGLVEDPGCGQPIFVDPLRGRVVASCSEGGRHALRLFGAGAPRTLAAFDRDVRQSVMPFGHHLLVTTRDLGDLMVDVETGEQRLSPKYQRLVAVRGDRTLVQRGEELVVLDGGAERSLGPIDPYPEIFGVRDYTTGEARRVVLVGTRAVDLARGEIAGIVPEAPPPRDGLPPTHRAYKPFAFTRQGWVLVDSMPSQRLRVVSQIGAGPMRWVRLSPPPGP